MSYDRMMIIGLAVTSTDQFVYAQAGLVPHTSGRFTGGSNWGANVIVDHFSKFISVHIMTPISG